ncbi:MAG: IS21 family transposase [Candidatus Dormibacteraeota bacterium]|nr:IS21 family transposase [Candidatus Dormibacteraeota bacterium]
MINVEDWAEVRRLHRAEGMGVKAIARRLGLARNTVRAALRSQGPPSYERERKGSIVDAVEPRIRELLGEFPDMPATVVAERVGWDRSIRVLRERVGELRPLFVPPDPCQRTSYRPGELAQFDLWQPDTEIPLGHVQVAKGWVVVGVSGFSRFIGAWMIPSRQAHDVMGGHLAVLSQFGALPRTVVWDQEAAIGRWRGREMAFTAEFQAFRGTLGIGALLCQRGDPEAKGLVERANGYLETSFLPGRRFDDVADFNRQLSGWLIKANNRIHATTKVRPREAMAEDRGAMLGFPPVLPDTSLRFSTRLPRDHYVRVDTNDYSVNPRFVGRRIQVRVELDSVVATCEATEVARHRRCLAAHQNILAPEHARTMRAMRAEQAIADAGGDGVEERDLADYDRITEVA